MVGVMSDAVTATAAAREEMIFMIAVGYGLLVILVEIYWMWKSLTRTDGSCVLVVGRNCRFGKLIWIYILSSSP